MQYNLLPPKKAKMAYLQPDDNGFLYFRFRVSERFLDKKACNGYINE